MRNDPEHYKRYNSFDEILDEVISKNMQVI